MNPKSKKIMTVGLALSAVGIWIPQLFMGVVDTTPQERQDVPNDGGSFEAAVLVDGEVAMDSQDPELGFMSTSSAAAGVPGAPEQELSLPKALSLASKQMAIRNSNEHRVGLSELIQAFRPEANRPQVNPAEYDELQNKLSRIMANQENGEATPGAGSTMAAEDVLQEFCEHQVLSAVIWGADGSVAMINNQVVRLGDVLAMGVQVKSIERRSVELAYRGATQWIGMPAFATRQPKARASGANEPTDGVDGELPPAEPAPAAGGAKATGSNKASEPTPATDQTEAQTESQES